MGKEFEKESIQFSHSGMSDSLRPHGLQHARPPYHQLLEFTQTHVHWVSDAIQPSHPLSAPSPPTFNLSQHQGLFKWVSSSHQVAKVLEFQLQHQSEKEQIYVYNWLTLMYSWNYHIINQLYSNIKQKVKKLTKNLNRIKTKKLPAGSVGHICWYLTHWAAVHQVHQVPETLAFPPDDWHGQSHSWAWVTPLPRSHQHTALSWIG